MNTQKLYSYVRQAIDRYLLIETQDHIAVGVSGGKDSLILLYALAGLQKFYPVPFQLTAVVIDLGFGMSYEPVVRFCEDLGVSCQVIPTSIKEIVFSDRKEKDRKSPCSLCANLRRGALVDAAKALGCTKIALGHHRDDIIHTMMMSMIHEGRFYSVSPFTAYEDRELAIIRPLIYLSEGEIKGFVEKMQFPVVANRCPMDSHSARSEMKDLVNQISLNYPGVRRQLFHAIETSTVDDWVQARARGEK
ncbi:MAG: tRNA 2-thiocytidine(32) synthetase TtcA [Lachnospiraceae bacterium]|nr:tRNA 2-thiocytidine(32) synthetase TtcA [Lachnospiraceae bacterium]